MPEQLQAEPTAALLAGRLEGIGVPDLLWALSRRKATGTLRLARQGVEKTLFFQDGRVVFGSSADPDDRLGELLLRQGMIGLDALEQALGGLQSGKRLGTLLVESGNLTPDELVRGVLSQVESIVLDVVAWEEGDYRFQEGPLPSNEVITLRMKTGELLLRGIRQIDSFTRIRRGVGPTHRIFGLTRDARELLEGVALTPGEELLVERLERGEASVETLCREVFLSNFEIYQTLWGFKTLGVVDELPGRAQARAGSSVEGTLQGLDFGRLLVQLGRGGETGVLYVTRGNQERTVHISGGRCIFATSNDPDNGLVAYLLRRGVISLRDREETAKRLLTNKRVGTILREIGVLDERDLREMVRQQLSEIIYDMFQWEDGDFSFVPGSLPSVEDITLDDSLERLIAGGLRRVRSWRRVWRGCGGLETTLQLHPSFLAVLDGMGAGPEEWQVVTALRTPRNPREICRHLDLSDFRVCQILWTLAVLGAVEPATSRAWNAADLEAASVDLDREPADEVTAAAESIPETEAELAPEPEAAPEPEHAERSAPAIEVPSWAVETPLPVADLDATQRIDREAIDAALRAAPEERAEVEATQVVERIVVERVLENEGPLARPAEAEVEIELADESASQPDAPAWEPPAEFDRSVARLNAAQRLIWRTVRAEVGAGATNLIRSWTRGLEPDAVHGVALHADGSWDPDELRRMAVELRMAEPDSVYDALVARQIEGVRTMFGEGRASELEQQVAHTTESQ